MAYIDKEKALSICQKYYLHCLEMHDFSGDSIADDIQTDIQNLPTADVVEVVRCKNCIHCCISTDPKTNISIQKCGYIGFNPVQSSQVSDDFYCSYGERKDGE